ncbi:MAG: TonB-dependent receptor [bacterium]|nr:TonB-dependent receptor [bacterium]
MFKQKKILLLVFCLVVFLFNDLSAYELTGYVFIKDTDIPVKNAVVQAGELKILCNKKGCFQVKDIKGSISIRISAKGYKETSKELTLTSNITENFQLELAGVIRAATQKVYADRDKEKISYYRIKQKSVKRLSENSLFSDTVTGLQMLPGVAAAGSFDARMYIRGGQSYEVVGILDMVPVYRPYFFGGKVSIFNPKIVETVDFYPGGFDSSYGQSLSGIIDVKTIEGNYEKNQYELDVNLTELNYFGTGPVEKGKSTVIASYRRTFYDLFAPLFIADSYGPVQMPYLQAFQSGYTSKLDRINKLTINMSYFNDGADIPDKSSMSVNNMLYNSGLLLGSLQLETVFNKSMINKASISLSKNGGYFKRTDETEINNTWDNAAFILRDDISIDIMDDHKLDFGGIIYKADNLENVSWIQTPSPWEPGSVTVNVSGKLQDDFYVMGLYLQDKWNFMPGNELKFGGRFDFTKSGTNNWNKIFQPRISYSLDLDNMTTVKAYYGKYSQQIFAGNKIFDNGDLRFMLADVEPEVAYHYGLGLEKYFSDNILLTSEVFYKDYENLVINMGNYPEDNKLNQGDGKAAGIELMLQKIAGEDYAGWITYTFSRTRRNDKQGWYVPEYDLTHMLNLYADIKMTSKNKLILAVKYSSGKAYTPVSGYTVNQVTGAKEYIEGARNSARTPDYFRIDVWYEWDGVEIIVPVPFLPLSEHKLWGIFPILKFKGVTRLGLFNALNNLNAAGVYWDDDSDRQGYINDLPRIPVYGYRIDF